MPAADLSRLRRNRRDAPACPTHDEKGAAAAKDTMHTDYRRICPAQSLCAVVRNWADGSDFMKKSFSPEKKNKDAIDIR